MTRTLKFAGPALCAGLLLATPACSSDEYGQARFVLTPDGGGAAMTVTVEAKYHNPVDEDCYLELYTMKKDNRYIQFSPLGIGSACEGVFEARIDVEGEQHDMNGFVQREFGVGTSTPFATGFYFATGGGSGQFSFYEDDLPDL